MVFSITCFPVSRKSSFTTFEFLFPPIEARDVASALGLVSLSFVEKINDLQLSLAGKAKCMFFFVFYWASRHHDNLRCVYYWVIVKPASSIVVVTLSFVLSLSLRWKKRGAS